MTSRRSVLKSAAAVGAAFHIVPRHVLGRGFTAPSDTVRLAAIGIGGKGESDITEMVKAGASVAAHSGPGAVGSDGSAGAGTERMCPIRSRRSWTTQMAST